MSRFRRAAPAALVAAVILCGCGKGAYVHQATTQTTTQVTTTAARPPHPAPAPAHPAQTAPTAALARAFGRAVELGRTDVTGASAQPPQRNSSAQEREAARCGGRTSEVIGGGRSPDLRRGTGLAREDISSSVEVLRSEAQVRSDLAYTRSRAGLRCYGRVLRNSLGAEERSNIRLTGLRIAPLTIAAGGPEPAAGLRIEARVALKDSPATLRLYSDAISFPYGAAEIDLFATSFVQPEALRTEQELITLLRERARRHPL